MKKSEIKRILRLVGLALLITLAVLGTALTGIAVIIPSIRKRKIEAPVELVENKEEKGDTIDLEEAVKE